MYDILIHCSGRSTNVLRARLSSGRMICAGAHAGNSEAYSVAESRHMLKETMTQMTQTSPQEFPDKASVATRIWTGLRALWVLKDKNADPDHARVLHLSFDQETYARLAREMRQTPEGRRLLDERQTIPDVDVRTLAHLPRGTLGYEYARYFLDNELDPFTFAYPLRNDADFLNKRYRETHDIHHLITGYGTDEVGEVELQAFYFGNLGFRHAALITFISVPYVLARGRGRGARALVRRLRAAYRRGKQSRQLLAVPFDELWEQPVADIARRICSASEAST